MSLVTVFVDVCIRDGTFSAGRKVRSLCVSAKQRICRRRKSTTSDDQLNALFLRLHVTVMFRCLAVHCEYASFYCYVFHNSGNIYYINGDHLNGRLGLHLYMYGSTGQSPCMRAWPTAS